MKRTSVRLGIATAATFAVAAFAPMSAQAQTQQQDRCANPSGSVEMRVCAVAAQGNEALRRFLFRTRGIYLVNFNDFARQSA